LKHFTFKILIILCLIIFLVACSEKPSKEFADNQQNETDTLVYDTAPRWMKTKNIILFYTYRHDAEGAELYTISPKTFELSRLTDTYHNEWWSEYSPLNDVIYVSSDFGKSKRFGGSEIFALKSDGTYARLTFSADTNSFNIYPRISPDGKRLLYTANALGKDVDSEIMWINIDGTNPINLTNHPSKDKYGSWSPDGKTVLFESNRSGNFELYLMDLATKRLTQLTDNEFSDSHAEWSIKNEIVFISNRDGDQELFTMKSDGSEQTQITFNDANDVLPSWSADGQKIAFSSYRFGKRDKGDIFMIDRDGKNEMRLTKR
jgi:Tol biopolymer transport system component